MSHTKARIIQWFLILLILTGVAFGYFFFKSRAAVTLNKVSGGTVNVNTTNNSNLTNSLVGQWSFNGQDMNGTTAYDRSGSGNNGTLTNGPTVIPGKLGQGLRLDGVDDHIVVPQNGKFGLFSTAFTVSTWINISAYPSSLTYRIISWSNGTNNIQLALNATSNQFSIANLSAAGNPQVNGTVVPALNTWYHVVGTFDGTNYTLYVDGAGTRGGTTVNNGVYLADTTNLYIGKRGDGAGYVAGSLDEIRIYNRALSATEVATLYNLGAIKMNSADSQTDPLERGLAGYWNLDENTGTTAADASGNANTGTLINGPTWVDGIHGKALNFNGTNQSVAFGQGKFNSLVNNYTYSSWIKLSSLPVASGAIIGHGSRSNILVNSSGNPVFHLYDGGGNHDVPASTVLSTNVWYHIVGIKDSVTGVSLYVNGSLVLNNTSYTSNMAPYSGDETRIGNFGWDGGNFASFFPGAIDEVRVYNRALSADEVTKLYQTIAPDNHDTSLKGHWSFNGPDISGTTAYDRSGSGNNGTLTNGPVATIGKIGQALSFNGTTQWICTNNNTFGNFGTSPFTVSTWIKTSMASDAGHNTVILSKMTAGGSVYPLFTGWNLWVSNGFPMMHTNGGAYDHLATATTRVNDGAWHLVTGVVNGTGMAVYIDGGLSVSNTGYNNNTTNTSINLCAAWQPNDAGYPSSFAANALNGSLDDIRIYNRALSASEISALYNMGK